MDGYKKIYRQIPKWKIGWIKIDEKIDGWLDGWMDRKKIDGWLNGFKLFS